MMRKIFFILIVVVLFACNAEKSESKGIKSNPNLKMYGKSFWKDKPFVTYTLASDLFPVRDFNEIVLDPVLKYDSNGGFGIRLLAEMTTKNKEGKADLFSHGTDVVAKIMDNKM
jgi:ABC-type oligopeptide transport system substrate-binding subunit